MVARSFDWASAWSWSAYYPFRRVDVDYEFISIVRGGFMERAVKVFVGRTKGRRGSIALETTRRTSGEVWDAIFYNIEKSNAQFPREKAPRMLGNKWQVIEISVEPPPNMTIMPDKFTIIGG